MPPTKVGLWIQGERSFTKFHSAGAHIINGLETMSSAFEGYWKTGVADGNKKDLSSLGNHDKCLVNPMFAVSSAPIGGFAVRYGSDPLLGFHLAEAFDSVEPRRSMVDRVAKIAKSQFRNWCDSVLKTIAEECVKIVLHCGDAISLCLEL